MDFNKLLGKTQQSKIINPIEIFDNLDKESDKVYLWPGQRTVLDLWYEKHRSKKDTIVKLHTGQGKTLIGLLMLQSLLNEGKGPALYLCPDNTLVKQTVNQAESFGIKIVEVPSETTALPREFLNSEAILITNCKKLFNGKSVFGVDGTGREIRRVGAIVVDDAHRCLEIIRDSFSIRSKKYIRSEDGSYEPNPVYRDFFNLFSDSLKKQSLGKYDDIIQERDEISLTIPYWAWQDKISDVMRIVSDNKDSWDIKFSWDLIKEQLEFCHCIFSGTRVEIVPRLVPINLIPSFSEAKHRIFLSATLTEDAFLIKDLDIDPDCVLNPLTDPELRYSGERLILLPTLVDPSLKREELIKWFSDLPKKYGNFGFFTIIPSGYHARFWKSATVIKTENFEELLDSLKDKIKIKKAFDNYLLLNKYDGIDLPSHTCRILCLDSLPSYDALIDRYNQSAMPNSTIIQRKLAQRIEQGIGRAIRGVNDYCVVIIIGTDISGFFSENSKRDYLSNEAQRQIKIGETLAEEIKKDGPALTAIENLIQNVISRNQGWKDYYKEVMKDIEIKPIDKIYINRLITEKTAETLYQKRQYSQAIAALGQIIEEVKFDKNELGWYLQLKAAYEYSTDKRKSLETQLSAFNTNSRLSRPPEGIQYAKLSKGNVNRAQRIHDYIRGKGNYTPLILEVENILDKLVFGVPSDLFEDGIDELGDILGFITDRPEQKEGCGPDNLWQINDDTFWIIECKNCVTANRGISKTEAGQLDTSIAWFEKKYEECQNVPIMIHPSNKLMSDAFSIKPFLAIRVSELDKLKNNVMNFYKSFSGVPPDSITADGIKIKIKEYALDTGDIKATFSRISK
ncbi:MAG: DEAD/DEAH box helicase [Methanoregula sp.]|jgi:tetratricopeptide (TPR) repeat protein